MQVDLRLQKKEQLVAGVQFSHIKTINPMEEIADEAGNGIVAWLGLVFVMSCITVCIININKSINDKKKRAAQALIDEEFGEQEGDER